LGLNQHPDAEIAQLLKQLDQGSKIMLIQVNGPETQRNFKPAYIYARTPWRAFSASARRGSQRNYRTRT
jgi:hypothetical protein